MCDQRNHKPISLARLRAVLQRFDITIAQAEDLLPLKDKKFAIIADDSGSMQNPALPSHLRSPRATDEAVERTRWAELSEAIAEVVSVADCLGSDGVDVHFLNRAPVRGVRDAGDPRLRLEFEKAPLGSTPLTKVLRRVTKSIDEDEDTILFIFTDGEPNHGRRPFQEALQRLVDRVVRVHVHIMAFTQDVSVAEWLGKLERKFHEVDFSDDFFSERREVLRTGLATRFTRGDWCAKAMLAAVTEKYAMWDKVLHKHLGSTDLCDGLPCSVM